MKKVTSSHIDSINYRPDGKVLEITFSNGKIYHYHNVAQVTYDNFLKAKSHGEFLHDHIIPKHNSIKKG